MFSQVESASTVYFSRWRIPPKKKHWENRVSLSLPSLYLLGIYNRKKQRQSTRERGAAPRQQQVGDDELQRDADADCRGQL